MTLEIPTGKEVPLCVVELSFSFNLQSSDDIHFKFPSIDSITFVEEA